MSQEILMLVSSIEGNKRFKKKSIMKTCGIHLLDSMTIMTSSTFQIDQVFLVSNICNMYTLIPAFPSSVKSRLLKGKDPDIYIVKSLRY